MADQSERPGVNCERCGDGMPLFLAVDNFETVEKLADLFSAKCPLCDHQGMYPKSAIQILRSEP
jgi:hypothetical protein